MATTPVEIIADPGLTLTADIYPIESDTASATSVSLTEETNRDGVYVASVTAALDGIYTIHVYEGSTPYEVWECDIQDTTDVCRAVEFGSALARREAAYSDGFIYLDLTSGVSGTRRGKNGTKTNPSNSWANTSTLMSLTGLRKVFATNASAGIQLTADTEKAVFDGSKYTFDPNSYSLVGSIIRQGVIDAKNFGDTNTMLVEECLVTGATFTSTSNECTFQKCQLRDTLVLKNGKFNFENCTDGEGSALADAQSPELDYNSVSSALRVRMANWSGEISISNMTDSLNHLYIYGNGILTLNATCSDGTIVHSSGIEIVDNSGGFSGTITKVENRVEITDGTITSDTYDESTAFPIASADSGPTAIARTGADGDTLETLSDQLDDKTGYALSSTGLNLITSWTVDITGSLSGSVANVTGGINTAAGTITTLDGLDTAQDTQHGTTQTAISNLNNISEAQVNAQVDTALADYDGPTKAEMDAAFTEIKGATWATTDTLEAIRDRGDAAWTTATGFSTHSAADVRSEMDSNSTQLAAIVADTDELQTNQGNWLTATGFSTHSAADVRTEMDSNSTQLAAIVADTNELQTNQGDWATADVSGLATAAALATVDNNVDLILEDTGTTIPAQIGSLNNFDPANDTVANVTLVDTVTTNTDMRGTDNALLAASAPANFSDLAITVTTGRVTVGTNTDKTGYSVASDGLDLVTAWTVDITGSVSNVTGGINTAAGTITTLDGLDTAQDSQHSTTQSAISGLNNISEAQVNAQVDTALSDFGGPTLTQMTAAFTEIKGATWATTDTLEEIRNNLGGGGGGDATEAKQDTIIAAIGALNDISAADVINYDMGNGRLVVEALAPLRNKWTISSGVYTVYDTDDSSVLWTAASTQTAGDPTSAMDPT